MPGTAPGPEMWMPVVRVVVVPLALAATFAVMACDSVEPAVRKDAVDARKAAPAEALDSKALCAIAARVDDAKARNTLPSLHSELETTARTDRVAAFGALHSIGNDKSRWKALKEDGDKHPASAVSPLGQCFVYAEWKMGDHVKPTCDEAAQKAPTLALVDVARADFALRERRLDDAIALLQGAVQRDGTCVPAIAALARTQALKGDAPAAVAMWERARVAWPQCFYCAVAHAELVEETQDKAAAAPLWEQAVALAPDHPDTLKRYAATRAGVDDAAALAAYEKVIALGVEDKATLVAAATLARGTPEKAIPYLQRALKKQGDDVDGWCLLLALADAKGDPSLADQASSEILRLIPDDAPAHLLRARQSQKAGDLVGAVIHYESALRSIAAGKDGALDATAVSRARADAGKLNGDLLIEGRGSQGSASSVVSNVQRTVKRLFAERLKRRPGLKGTVEVAVQTTDTGSVEDVSISQDTLGDPTVSASIVGNLRRAKITGGAKRYSFAMEFE